MLPFAVLFLWEISLLIIAFILCGKDILSPSVVVLFMFFFSTVFAATNIENWNINLTNDTLCVLISGTLIFVIIDVLVCNFVNKTRKNQLCFYKIPANVEKAVYVQPFFLIIISLTGIITVVWYYKEVNRIINGYGYSVTGSLVFSTYRNILTSLSNRSESKVELTGVILNQLTKIVRASGYVSAYILARNMQIKHRKRYQMLIHAFIIILNLILSVMEGARGSMLLLISAFVAAYYIEWHRINGWKRMQSIQFVWKGIIGIAIGIPAFYGSSFLVGYRTEKAIYEYISGYVGGSIQLLNLYSENPVTEINSFGEETLLGLYPFLNMLGIDVEQRKATLEFRALNSLSSGNVYTFFRRPLHDFGFVGMIVFTMLFSFIFSYVYHKKIRGIYGRKSEITILIYCSVFYWLVVSSIENYCFSLSLNWFLQTIIMVVLYSVYRNIRIFHGRFYIRRSQ